MTMLNGEGVATIPSRSRAVVAMLAFAAADRAEVPAQRRNFDERIRTRVAFEVEPAADVPRMGRRVRLRDVAALPTAQRDL
jgi:hypothetical protein